MTSSHVYLVKVKGTSYYKIGISKNPKDRLSGMQTGCPLKILPVYCVPSYVAERVEATLHEQYVNNNVLGEWFDLSDEEVKRIITLMNLAHCDFLIGDPSSENSERVNSSSCEQPDESFPDDFDCGRMPLDINEATIDQPLCELLLSVYRDTGSQAKTIEELWGITNRRSNEYKFAKWLFRQIVMGQYRETIPRVKAFGEEVSDGWNFSEAKIRILNGGK